MAMICEKIETLGKSGSIVGTEALIVQLESAFREADQALEIQLKKIRSPIDRIRPKPVERHCMGYQKKTFLLTFDNLLQNLYLCPHHWPSIPLSYGEYHV
jgi:hypothetical protein